MYEKNDQVDIELVHQNFQFLYGCRPSRTVEADTEMVYEITETFETMFDKNELTLKFPDVFA